MTNNDDVDDDLKCCYKLGRSDDDVPPTLRDTSPRGATHCSFHDDDSIYDDDDDDDNDNHSF